MKFYESHDIMILPREERVDSVSREEYIKELIKEKGQTIKQFAQQIDMPYSTLLSMLNGSIGGAAVDNVIKICKGLGISINDLQKAVDETPQSPALQLSDHERHLVMQYRKNKQMQSAVDTLLGL